MKIYLLLLSGLISILSCKNEKKVENNSSTSSVTNTQSAFVEPLAEGFHHLQGKIGNKYSVTLNFFVENNQITGTMYYDKVGKYIKLKGNISNNGHISIKGTAANNKISDIFEGQYSNDIFSGTWSSDVTDKTYPFKLAETNENYVLLDSLNYSYEDSLKINGQYAYFSRSVSGKLPKAYPIPEVDKKIDKELKDAIVYSSSVPIISDDSVIKIDKELKKFMNSIEKGNYNIIPQMFKQEAEKWKKQTLKIISPDDEYANGFTSDEGIKFSVIMDKNAILTMAVYNYGYEGGAHGLAFNSFGCYDLMTGDTLKYDDVFTGSKQQLIDKVIIPNLRKYCKKEYGEDMEDVLFDPDNIPFPDEFYISDEGIGFYYGEYSITAYVYGTQEFVIKYDELKDYLTEDFKKRMGL